MIAQENAATVTRSQLLDSPEPARFPAPEISPLFTRRMIGRIAAERLREKSLLGIFLRQAWAEIRLRLLRGVNFRWRENARAREAYGEMAAQEFEGINARQQWANWRTIPKNLSGLVGGRPVLAIDLCCGVGHSTEVLACYLPSGSRILGLEYSPRFVELARTRRFRDRAGKECDVSFRAQSVLETFRNEAGQPIPPESVDLVNSSGAVGCHFDREATATLAEEVARVLKRGGLALIDSGFAGTRKADLVRIFETRGFETVRASKSCFLDPYTQVCFRKR